LAYVTVIIRGRLLEVDSSLEEAALDLGAKPSQVFFLITLPIISPALFSGWLLAFALSMDDLVIASFTSGPGSSTLPMVIFSSIRLGATPEINALATLIVLIVSFFVVMAALLMRKGHSKRIF
jgi:putrescine transport system permease protein